MIARCVPLYYHRPPWAQNEFGFAQLGDQRRNKRLVNIAEHFAGQPRRNTSGKPFHTGPSVKGAYRFFGQRALALKGHSAARGRTRQACRQPGEYLQIEDTTLLDYSHHPAAEDLGCMEMAVTGFELHSALAVRVEGGRWSNARGHTDRVNSINSVAPATPPTREKNTCREG